MADFDYVWKNSKNFFHVYNLNTENDISEILELPGVYSWYYPLKIRTKNLLEFLDEIKYVFSYDSKSDGFPIHSHNFDFTWEIISLEIRKNLKDSEIKNNLKSQNTWENIIVDNQRFENFRLALYKASILMPPLYVGKAKNVSARIREHLTENSGLAKRYNKFISQYSGKEENLLYKNLNDLLVSVVYLKNDEEDELLLENILKFIARPSYGRF